MTSLDAFLLVALPALGALLAVGALRWIKVQRRRQGPCCASRANPVPIRALSEAQVQRWRRRYRNAVLWVLLLLALYAAALALVE